MELLRNLFTYLMTLISLEPPVPTGSELTGFDPDDGYGFDFVAFFYMIQEGLYGGGKLLLESMLDLLHPVLDFHELTLVILLIMALVYVVYWTITLWAKKRTISRMGEEEKRKLEMLLADIRQQEGKIYMLELENIIRQHEKEHLQSKIMQEKSEAKDQCQEADSAPQALGSEHHEPKVKCVPRSEKPMTWKAEEGERSNDILKIQHEKEHLELQSVIMQEKPDAKDQCQDADSAPQASGSGHHEPEVKCVPRSEKLMTWKTEERKRSNDILKMQMELHKKQAEETLIGVRVVELALATEREENAKLRQKFIEINAELAEIRDPVTVPPLKKDGIASCRLGKAAFEESTEKLQGEKILQLEDKIKTMENDRASLKNEITTQGNLYKILQEKLLIMDTLCQEKDYTLQQMLALEEVEQHVKHIKSAGPKQEVRNFKQRILEINAKHEKAQDSLKKEISFHKKTAEDNWVVACTSKSALTTKKKEVAILSKKLSEFSASMAGYQEPMVSAISGRSDPRIRPLNKDDTVPKKNQAAVTMVDKSAQSSDQLQWYRCQAELADEKTKVERLRAKIGAMEEEREALRKEMLKLEFQNRTSQGEVQSLNEQCKQKDQALQLKTAQVDFERRDKERKVKEVLKVHKLKVQKEVQSLNERCKQKDQALQLKTAQVDFERRDKERKVKEVLKVHKLKVQKEVQSLNERCKQKDQALQLETARVDFERRDKERKVKEVLKVHELKVQKEVQSLNEQCKQKDQALQLKTARVDFERREKEMKVKEVLKVHKLKVQKEVQSLNEQCKQKDQALQLKTAWVDFERRDKERKVKEVLKVHKLKVQKEVQSLNERCKQKDQALQLKTAQVDFERRDKERKVKEVLKVHKLKVQKEVQSLNERCKQKDQALQLETARVDFERRDKERKVKEVLKVHELKVQKEVQSLNEQCKQKDQALQLKTARVDFERREKEMKVKEVLKVHKLKVQKEVQSLNEQCKQKDQALQLKTAWVDFERRDKERKVKEVLKVHKLKVQKEVQSLNEQCKQKDQALQLETARVDFERREKEMKVKEVLKVHKLKVQKEVQSLNEQCKQKDQALQLKTARVDFERRDKERKVKEVLKVHELKVQKEVQSLNEQCKQKDQALQLKTARVDFERRDKELKVKEVLKVHKLKVQSIVEEHQKSELSYKAEIASLKKSQDKLMKTCASGHAQMTNLYKQREVNSRTPSVATPDSGQETPREKKTVATQASFRGCLEKTVKLPNAAEGEQSLHLQKLQLEEKRSQGHLEEKIQTLEQSRNTLMSDNSQLEDQNAALQSELLFANERFEQRGQTLQLSAVQAEVELMREELESHGRYKARMQFQERQAQENMTIAMDISVAQAETIADLQNELAKANAKLAKLRAGPSFLYQALPLPLYDSEDVPLPGPATRSPGFSVTHLSSPLPSLGEFESPRPPDLSARSSYDIGGFCKVQRLSPIAEERQLPQDFGETEGWERGGEAE